MLTLVDNGVGGGGGGVCVCVGGGWGEGWKFPGSAVGGYVPAASQSPCSIILFFVLNERPDVSDFY